jgi:hypothetical protein
MTGASDNSREGVISERQWFTSRPARNGSCCSRSWNSGTVMDEENQLHHFFFLHNPVPYSIFKSQRTLHSFRDPQKGRKP